MTDINASFSGNIPAIYDRCLGPLMFEPSARDFGDRWPWASFATVLELAAGTGILTHHLRAAMAPAASLTATDLNPDMLAVAKTKYPGLPVTWQQTDAQALPFPAASFDAVACAYGVMFFPDKPGACREIRRVLKPGGLFAFSVWDSMAHNPIAAIARDVVNRYFASDPPSFYEVPFGFADENPWRSWLTAAGFELQSVHRLSMTNPSPSAAVAAEGLISGNPTILAIEERATAPASVIISETAAAVGARFGTAPCHIPMQAVLFAARAI